jgi:hypothetical protein
MADINGANGTYSTHQIYPDRLNTPIESGTFDEKAGQFDHSQPSLKQQVEEEEDEDMDALIDELESQDGHIDNDEEDEHASPGEGRQVPEDQLQTDTRVGLTEAEVVARRRKYGMNQLREEKENLFLKFLWYFVGPIQFVMEVCLIPAPRCFNCPACSIYHHITWQCLTLHNTSLKCANRTVCDRLLLSLLPAFKTGSISVSFVRCFSSTLLWVSFRNTRRVQSSTN